MTKPVSFQGRRSPLMRILNSRAAPQDDGGRRTRNTRTMKRKRTKSRSKKHLQGVEEGGEGGEEEGEEEEGEEGEGGEGGGGEVEEDRRLPLTSRHSCSLQKANWTKVPKPFRILLETPRRKRPEK